MLLRTPSYEPEEIAMSRVKYENPNNSKVPVILRSLLLSTNSLET
jgi:hypothetical protein